VLLIDRYIFKRFAANFIILFALLFVFAAAIDLILNLDRFIDVARAQSGEDASMLQVTASFFWLMIDFELPRIFQFYAYLHGMVAVGAMAFTLAHMHRYKELVAVMASGMSLYRIALPFFIAAFFISLIQLANQELLLPRVAPLLLRGHSQIGESSVNEFEVQLTTDARGNVMQSPSFNPATNTLLSPTILERNERGLTTRRISADKAVWDQSQQAWLLTNGQAVLLPTDDVPRGRLLPREPIELYQTDLDPRVLTVRRHSQFAAMLSLNQISEMLDSGGVANTDALMRYGYSRFATVLMNLLVMALTLPCFLLREPSNLLRKSVLCAALAIPAMLGAAVGMMADLPGIPPAGGVFLPIVILLFVALVPWTYFKT
jgi:lipopolysaccharide export system permease protein